MDKKVTVRFDADNKLTFEVSPDVYLNQTPEDIEAVNEFLKIAESSKHFREETELRRNIQPLVEEQQKLYQEEINKIQTMFSVARIWRRKSKKIIEQKEVEGRIIERSMEWQISSYDQFKSGKKKFSLLRKTRRNLRIALKNHRRSIEVKYRPFGQSYTCLIYSNPMIQSFFEISLLYASTKEFLISVNQAKSIFLKLCQTSLGLKISGRNDSKLFNEYLNFYYEKGRWNTFSGLPPQQSGRPLGQKKSDTEKVLRLAKQGKSNREISIELKKGLSSPLRAADVARIGKLTRQYKLPAKNRKK